MRDGQFNEWEIYTSRTGQPIDPTPAPLFTPWTTFSLDGNVDGRVLVAGWRAHLENIAKNRWEDTGRMNGNVPDLLFIESS